MQNEVKRKKKAWKRYIQTNNEIDKIEYNNIRNQVKRKIKEAKKKSWEEFGDELNKNYKKIIEYSGTRLSLRGEKRKQIRGIRNEQDQLKVEAKKNAEDLARVL